MLGRIVDIVRESGARVASARDFSVEDKGTRENVVTSIDIENEGFLRERLTSLVPGSSFMGEEGDDGALLEDGYTWIVDPIDGTMNFSRGIPEVGISVALFRDGEPHIGVVHNPFNGRTWWSEIGRGAWMDGEPVRVSDRPREDAILSTAWCCYGKELAPGVFAVSEDLYPRINDIRRIGTAAVELSMLSQGAVEMYFEIRLSPWDYAAGLTCVEAAGGCHTGIDGDVSFERPSPVLAANSEENLAELLDVVREHFPNTPYRWGPRGHAYNLSRVDSVRMDKESPKCGSSKFGQMCSGMGGYAPDTLKAINELDPSFVDTLHTMDRVMVEDGALDRKTKRLMALSCVCVRMCEDCVYPQARVAKNYGATKEEILEAVKVAVLIGGVPCWSVAKKGIARLFSEWED